VTGDNRDVLWTVGQPWSTNKGEIVCWGLSVLGRERGGFTQREYRAMGGR